MLRYFGSLVLFTGLLSGQTLPYVGLGDSIGEGVQSADASTRTQPYSYLKLVANQMGVDFPLPLIYSSPFGVINQMQGRFRINPNVPGANLAVSGADVHSILYETASLPVDTEADLVLLPRTGSQVDIAESIAAPFNICWIGNNDVLGAILAWDHLDASQMTPVANFTTDFGTLVQRLTAQGRHVVFANIPSVTTIAFTVTPQDMVRFLGSDYGLPPGYRTTIVVMLMIKMGLIDPSVLQDPNYVLDPNEIAAIEDRLNTFNAIIAADAAQAGMPVVDMNGIFKEGQKTPPVFFGVPLTTSYLGGLFSLDGVHPSNIGHALAANYFIAAANSAFQMQVPPIGQAALEQIFLDDPFVDKDGDLKVRGRPLAGLMETLAPFFGISGDFDDHVPQAAKPGIDSAAGRAFMRQYLALKGRSPEAAWTRADVMQAFREIFATDAWKKR